MKTNLLFNALRGIFLSIILVTVVSCEKEIPVASLSLDRQEATVQVGATVAILPVIDPLDATNRNVTWTSSNTGIATVNDGVVTGVALGNATITATSEENPLFTASCEVTVVP